MLLIDGWNPPNKAETSGGSTFFLIETARTLALHVAAATRVMMRTGFTRVLGGREPEQLEMNLLKTQKQACPSF